jgi:hypothetical protein
MGDQTQAYDIFQTPLSSGYPLPLRKQKGKESIAGNTRVSTREWRGFITHSGVSKAGDFKAAKTVSKSFQMGKFHPSIRMEGGQH